MNIDASVLAPPVESMPIEIKYGLWLSYGTDIEFTCTWARTNDSGQEVTLIAVKYHLPTEVDAWAFDSLSVHASCFLISLLRNYESTDAILTCHDLHMCWGTASVCTSVSILSVWLPHLPVLAHQLRHLLYNNKLGKWTHVYMYI